MRTFMLTKVKFRMNFGVRVKVPLKGTQAPFGKDIWGGCWELGIFDI